MSQVKQQKRVKTGTVAIIALSLVLVLSLVATITLAYFTASRNVVTTIKFANGVSLQMHGVSFKEGDTGYTGQSPDTPPSNIAAALYWNAKAGTGGSMRNVSQTGDNPGFGGYEDVNDLLEFENMKIRTVDSPAFVAIKLIVTAKNVSGADVTNTLATKTGFTLPAFADDWEEYNDTTKGTANTAAGTNGVVAGSYWYVYTGGNGTIAKLANKDKNNTDVNGQNYAGTEDDPDNYKLIFGNYGTNEDEGYKIPNDAQYMNDFAGMTFTFRVVIVASDTQAGLNAMIGSVPAYVNVDSYGATPTPTP